MTLTYPVAAAAFRKYSVDLPDVEVLHPAVVSVVLGDVELDRDSLRHERGHLGVRVRHGTHLAAAESLRSPEVDEERLATFSPLFERRLEPVTPLDLKHAFLPSKHRTRIRQTSVSRRISGLDRPWTMDPARSA
jgi:hypothetical protein